jgi:hypothetical protein
VYGEKREQRRSNRQEVTRRSARSMWRVASKASGGWCAGSSSSPTSTRGTGCPATWTSGQSLTAEAHLAPSTIRGYQTELRLFNEYLCDARYGWVVECQKQFGPSVHPVPICHEWNTIAHLSDYGGRPEARPFTRTEVQRFFDYADAQVERAVRAKR